MRVLITGASGYLGRHLLAAAPSHWQITACFHHQPLPAAAHITPVQVDIADAAAVAACVAAARPDLVIHLAIARQPEAFARVIVQGSAHVAAAARTNGSRFIHLSTDIVFDGAAVRYDESDLPCPEPAPGAPDALAPHGRAKARAEMLVRQLHPDAVIVRTSLIYGLAPLDHSTRWLVDGLRSGAGVRLFTDQIRCPIFAPELAAALIELAALPFTGTMHLVGPEALSRYDFGILLCRALRLDPTGITPQPTPPDVIAPKRLVLVDTTAHRHLHTRPRPPHAVIHALTIP